MKIALLTLDFPPSIGGIQTYLFEIACRLGRIHDLTIVCSAASHPPPRGSFRLFQLSSTRLHEIYRALIQLRPDKILVGHVQPRLLLPAALARWGRYATLAHGDDYFAMQNHWHSPLSNRLLRASHPLITTSQFNAGRLQRLGMPVQQVIPLGTDPARFHPAGLRSQHPLTLLTVSRLVDYKGIDLVIRLLPTLLAEFPDLVYRIAGDGADRARLEELSARCRVDRAVRFLGQIPEEDLPGLYRSADIFVMPSSREGFGLAYLEASASGLPVVAGRAGGAWDAVREGETGYLVSPTRPEETLEALFRLLRDRGLRQKMGRNGQRFVERERTWDRTVEKLSDCLEAEGV